MTTTSTTSTSRTDRLRAQLLEHYGLTCPPLFGPPRDFDRLTYGAKVAKIAAKLGTPLMPWQRYVVDVALEVDPATGMPAYREVGVTVPRQSGKTSVILPVAVHRALAWQKQRILYAAQSGTAAREKWEDDHVAALEASVFAARMRVRKANGREAIIWRATRSMHGITTNTEKAGHGKTLDLGFADELFAQVDWRLDQAWGPAMITRPRAQRWWFSTAGTSKSVPLNAKRERGRALITAGAPTRIAYFEWTAPAGADRTAPATWWACMPALGYTVTEDAVRAELDSMEPAEFDRAYLNITREDDEVTGDPNVPSVEAWELLADAAAAGGDVVALAIDVTPQRDHAAITAAGDGPDGQRRIVVVEHGPGTSWVVPRVLELAARLAPVAWCLDEKSAAASLIEPLRQAGIVRATTDKLTRGQLWVPTTADVGAACGSFADAVRQGSVVHLGQPALTAAIAGARTRPLGDGAWAFGRKVASVDISPLVTASLALATYERFKHLAAPTDPLNVW